MDHQTIVIENRAALQATIEFGTRRLGAARWEPTTGSEAVAELLTGQTKADGTPWAEDQPGTAYAAANLMMHGVLDNLAALYQLLDDRMSVIGPPSWPGPRSRLPRGSGGSWNRASACGTGYAASLCSA